MPDCGIGPQTPLYFTPEQIATFWIRQGGAAGAVVIAVAVALAESVGGDAHAVSSACAIGLWQILYTHAAENGFTVTDFLDPDVNAYLANLLSANGRNWAAFDTVYATVERAAQRSPIAYPEAGSPAYNQIAGVAAALGVTGGGGAGMPSADDTTGLTGEGPAAPGTPSGRTQPGPTPAPRPFTGLPPGQWEIPPLGLPAANHRGWDNLTQFWGSDQADLISRDTTYMAQVAGATGGPPWTG